MVKQTHYDIFSGKEFYALKKTSGGDDDDEGSGMKRCESGCAAYGGTLACIENKAQQDVAKMFAGEDEWRYACEDSGNDFTAWRRRAQDYGICKIEQCAAIGTRAATSSAASASASTVGASDYFRANKGKIESEHCTAGDIVLIIFFCMLPFICCCCIVLCVQHRQRQLKNAPPPMVQMTQTAPAPPQAYAQPAPQYQQPIQQGQIVGQPYQQPIQQGQIVGQAYQQPIQQGRVVPGQVVEGSVVQGTYNPVQPGYAPVENPHEPGAKVF
ncbi:hypothetical protein JL721_2486 [Aureococcus anophagefferens]|nr:hypothetical protein JL721_2486 [Aureococcus anophagefferens]